MKLPIIFALSLSLSSSLSIKSRLKSLQEGYSVEECLDPNGDCTRNCHIKWLDNYGECPKNQQQYNPRNYDYNYFNLMASDGSGNDGDLPDYDPVPPPYIPSPPDYDGIIDENFQYPEERDLPVV